MSARASFNVGEHLSVYSSATWISERYAATGVDSGGAPTFTTEGAQLLVNLFLTGRDLGFKGLDLGVGVDNALDVKDDYIQPYNSSHAPLPYSCSGSPASRTRSRFRDRGAVARRSPRPGLLDRLVAQASALVAAGMLVSGALAAVFAQRQTARFEQEIDRRGRSLLQTLERHQDLRLAISLQDGPSAQRVLEDVLGSNSDMEYLGMTDPAGKPLAWAQRGRHETVAELESHTLDASNRARSGGILPVHAAGALLG